MGLWGLCREGACESLASEVIVELVTDTWANETTWQLLTADGEGIYYGFGLLPNTTYAEPFMLTPGQYCIQVADSYGDGGAHGSVTVAGLPVASWGGSDYAELLELCFDVEAAPEYASIPTTEGLCTDAGGDLESVRNQICDSGNNLEACAWDC